MYILSYDTSYVYSSISIDKFNGVSLHNIGKLSFDGVGKQAKLFIYHINNLLEKHNIKYNDIDYIVNNIGPGNFTSMRISASITKAIMLAFPNIKLFCLDSLQALLFQFITEKYNANLNSLPNKNILTIIETNMLEACISIFDYKLNRLENIKYIEYSEVYKLLASEKYSVIILQKKKLNKEYNEFVNMDILKSLFYVDFIKAEYLPYIFLYGEKDFLSNKDFNIIY